MKPRKIGKTPEEIIEAEKEQKRRDITEAEEDGDHWTSTRRRHRIYEGIEATKTARNDTNEAGKEGNQWETLKRRKNTIKPRKVFEDKKTKT